MRIYALSIIAGIVSLGSSQAIAERIVNLPPLTQETVHGGRMGIRTCHTADMLDSALYGDGGTSFASQTYKLSLKNLSTRPQTVTVGVLAGTKVQNYNSGGAADAQPNVTGPVKALSTTKQVVIEAPSWGI